MLLEAKMSWRVQRSFYLISTLLVYDTIYITKERVQPVSPRVLYLVGNASHRKKLYKNKTKLRPKKNVKIVWFGCQVAVCVNKRHNNAIFKCSWFQKFNFDCLLLLAPDLFTKKWKHIQLCVSFIDSVIYHDFRDLSIFHPLFCIKSQIMMLSPKFQKPVLTSSLNDKSQNPFVLISNLTPTNYSFWFLSWD